MMTFLILFTNLAWSLTASQPAHDPLWQNVVQIRTEAQDSDGSGVPAYCNATLLSFDRLITAAHCVHHAFVLKQFDVQIEIGAYKWGHRSDGSAFRIGYVTHTRAVRRATFQFAGSLKQKMMRVGLRARIGAEDDLAVVQLADPLPLTRDIQFARPVTDSEFKLIKNDPSAFSPTVVTINFMEEISTNDTKRSAVLENLKMASGFKIESRSTSRVQAGDSGAPLFVRIGNEWKILGVVKGRAETLFSNWDAFCAANQKLN